MISKPTSQALWTSRARVSSSERRRGRRPTSTRATLRTLAARRSACCKRRGSCARSGVQPRRSGRTSTSRLDDEDPDEHADDSAPMRLRTSAYDADATRRARPPRPFRGCSRAHTANGDPAVGEDAGARSRAAALAALQARSRRHARDDLAVRPLTGSPVGERAATLRGQLGQTIVRGDRPAASPLRARTESRTPVSVLEIAAATVAQSAAARDLIWTTARPTRSHGQCLRSMPGRTARPRRHVSTSTSQATGLITVPDAALKRKSRATTRSATGELTGSSLAPSGRHQGSFPNTGQASVASVSDGRVRHELPDLLSTAASNGGLRRPFHCLVA